MSRKKKRPSQPSRFKPILRSVATLALGAIMGLLIPVYFVKLLPGPRVDASIQQLNIKTGNASGCTAYIVLVGSSKPLEYLSLAVQFPRNVSNYQVGSGQQFLLSASQHTAADIVAYGRDPNGDCILKADPEPNDPDLHVWRAGPGVIKAETSKTTSDWRMFGFFALSLKKPSFSPAVLYTEGSYEYSIFGIAVKQRLTFQHLSTSDAK
jgi:hypothetical protein